jgi:hypothetical protein
MRRIQLAAVLLITISGVSWASNYVVPNTTLAAQTANNTSASNAFASQSNGNLGANNASKVDVHSLLYSGATTKVFAHLMLWFGQSNHMNVGYSSTDPAQVQRQITDMISRGIDGVVIDWYGPNNFVDQATQAVMHEAEKHSGFTFAIMIDAGAIAQNPCSGCSSQQSLINLLQYVEQKYFVSNAYFKIGGQPVVTNFNVDRSYSIDWVAVNAAVSIHPRFLFQDNDGFSHSMSDGSYSWVMPGDSSYGLSYLSNFYGTGLSFPNTETVGAAYKGFNDSLASWGQRRVMGQQCGQTWLQTFSQANSLYNSGKQLPYLQLLTWNDYEEGTEIESGIDNCFSLTASVSGSALKWGINGNENTVDHYNVYISTDGQNLMTLTEAQPGLHSINLCSFPIPSGSYKLFVQAVGKPTLANRMPGPVSYTPACGGTPGGSPGNSSFTASPAALTIPSGQSGQVTVTATAQSVTSNGTISLSCDFLPSNLVCSFSPATIKPGSGTATSTLKITNAAASAKTSSRRSSGLVYAGWIFSFGFAGLVFAGNFKSTRRVLPAMLACAVVGSMMLTASCGGSKSSALSSPGANAYTISILGNSGSSQISTEVVISVP